MATASPAPAPSLAPTAVAGLDDVLSGGLTRNRLFLLEGVPGSGKTTLALQFLRAAAARGEPVLYVTLSETADELHAVARSHGWDLDRITIQELVPSEASADPEQQYTMYYPSEVELGATVKEILHTVERLNPTCVVFDSLSELRLLAGNALRYRRQILALKQFFAGRNCTAMLLDDMTATEHDLQMQSIAHGVIRLEQQQPDYGAERRRLRVIKYRGTHFRGGYHDYVIAHGGLRVFPRLVASEHRRDASRHRLASDVTALDTLLGGGLEEGTSTLIVGAAGTGKSTLAAQFAAAAANRGERSALFVFDESPATLVSRCEGLHIALAERMEAGLVTLHPVDPAELSPGEFVNRIRDAVDAGVSMVVIDSLNGYLNAMPGEKFLTIQLHELLMYLGHRGVATILVAAHHGMVGSQMNTPVDASYLADAVILLRYFEAAGEVRQAISVVKKRGSRHERTIREFRLDDTGIHVGEPLREFRGILTGVPIYEGTGRQRRDPDQT
jgi:circadian clock protein KaiC